MAVEYCTAIDVAQFANVLTAYGDRAVFGENPKLPNQAEVEDYIEIAEELIEKRCNNAWGSKNITVQNEMHDVWTDRYGTEVHFDHHSVITPLLNGTDKLEVWRNDAWEEWLGLGYVEGRGDDFFVDGRVGKIMFLARSAPPGEARLRVSYRYNGGTLIPKTVRLCTALQVGILLLDTEYSTILWPEGQGGMTNSERSKRWEEFIDEKLKYFEVSITPTALKFTPVRY